MLSLLSPITSEQIAHAQREDAEIMRTVRESACEEEVTAPNSKKVRIQLLLSEGVLCWNLKLPLEGVVTVPVIPGVLQEEAVRVAHANTGHASSECMYDLLRSECYFLDMAATCQAHIQQCVPCACVNAKRGGQAGLVRADVPSRPWQEVVIETLQNATDRSGQFHSILVLVDAFSKWAEIVPLRHRDARSVAEAISTVCLKCCPRDVVHVDNGTEFANVIVESMLETFGVRIRTGVVRHQQTQGSAALQQCSWPWSESSLMIRRRGRRIWMSFWSTIGTARKAQQSLHLSRPWLVWSQTSLLCSLAGRPFRSVPGSKRSRWEPQEFVTSLMRRGGVSTVLVFGWWLCVTNAPRTTPEVRAAVRVWVACVRSCSPSTIRIQRGSQEKTVNVALIKPDLSDDTTERVPAGEDRGVSAILGVEREVCGPPPLYFMLDSRAQDTGRNLRDRSSLRPPERYQ